MDNTIVIMPLYKFISYATPIFNTCTLKIDCQPASSIIISDSVIQDYNIRFTRRLVSITDLYINVNSLLTCESFMVDSECIYTIYPGGNITFVFNDYEIYIVVEKDVIEFASVLASMYAVWLVFCGNSEKVWLANVMAQPKGNGKPSIELLIKTLQGLWSSKRFNLKDFDIKHIPYIKDVFKNCTYEFLEDTIHFLDKEQIISIIEELDEDQGERKAMLIQAAGLKDNNKYRFEL